MAKTQSIVAESNGQEFKQKEEKVPKTALTELDEVMKFVNICAFITGLEFVNEWKINRRTVFTFCVNLTATICTFYSMYSIWPSTDNIVMAGGFSFNIMIYIKLIFVICNHDKYMSLVNFIYKVYKCNVSGERESILLKVTEKCFYHLKINMTCVVGGAIIYSTFPVYNYMLTGELALVSPLVLPKIDPHKWHGYCIITFFNVFLVGFTLNVCVAVSCLLFLSVDAYDGLVSLIEHDFTTFDKMCEKKERGRMYQAPFRNLMVGCTDLARFSSYTNDLYGLIATVQVAISYLVVVSLLGAVLALDFIGGLGGALTFYCELLLYCYMGQLLFNTNERIITVIYNAKWYTYNLRYQKDIITALYLAQNQGPISLLNVYPLNFDTGLKITNNIYSLIMFMLSFFG